MGGSAAGDNRGGWLGGLQERMAAAAQITAPQSQCAIPWPGLSPLLAAGSLDAVSGGVGVKFELAPVYFRSTLRLTLRGVLYGGFKKSSLPNLYTKI
eukprot:768316-Hanusia_phi.AAC.3